MRPAGYCLRQQLGPTLPPTSLNFQPFLRREYAVRVAARGTGRASGTVDPDVPAPTSRGPARPARATKTATSRSSTPARRPPSRTAPRPAARRPPARRPARRRDPRWVFAGALLALGLGVTLLARDLIDLLPDELPLVPGKKACQVARAGASPLGLDIDQAANAATIAGVGARDGMGRRGPRPRRWSRRWRPGQIGRAHV